MTASNRTPTGTPHFARLGDYQCLVVSGPDAVAFLQGQLSCDLDSPEASTGQLSSFNTPQGRVIAMPRMLRVGDTVFLVLPSELAGPVAAQLGRFVLRAKVTLEIPPAIEVLGLMSPAPRAMPAAPGLHVLELPADGLAMAIALTRTDGVSASGSFPWLESHADDWLAAETAAGLPEVFAATSGQFVPQMLNLDLLGGISFTKGCFVGQEIVARAHHLGRIKRRTHLFAGPGGSIAPGQTVYRGDRAAGAVVRTAALGADRDMILASIGPGSGPISLAGQTGELEELELPYSLPVSPD